MKTCRPRPSDRWARFRERLLFLRRFRNRFRSRGGLPIALPTAHYPDIRRPKRSSQIRRRRCCLTPPLSLPQQKQEKLRDLGGKAREWFRDFGARLRVHTSGIILSVVRGPSPRKYRTRTERGLWGGNYYPISFKKSNQKKVLGPSYSVLSISHDTESFEALETLKLEHSNVT